MSQAESSPKHGPGSRTPPVRVLKPRKISSGTTQTLLSTDLLAELYTQEAPTNGSPSSSQTIHTDSEGGDTENQSLGTTYTYETYPSDSESSLDLMYEA